MGILFLEKEMEMGDRGAWLVMTMLKKRGEGEGRGEEGRRFHAMP